jgi:hypothetical protein
MRRAVVANRWFSEFCFHGMLGLGNRRVIRPTAAFSNFAQAKRGMPAAQDNSKRCRWAAPRLRQPFHASRNSVEITSADS